MLPLWRLAAPARRRGVAVAAAAASRRPRIASPALGRAGLSPSLRRPLARSLSSFDVFAKLKDPAPDGEAGAKKRKPSDKVLRLVDEIMSLNLIEAADLCDLCQEKLAPGDGAPIPGRMPFPHPMGMFPGGGGMPMMPGAMPAMPAQAAPQAAAPAAAPPADAAPAEEAESDKPAAAKKEEKQKEFVTIKLLSFQAAKKINVVKEVRAVTQLGLKESKDLVEGAPKVVKKGVPFAEAEAFRDKLIAAGAEVSIE